MKKIHVPATPGAHLPVDIAHLKQLPRSVSRNRQTSPSGDRGAPGPGRPFTDA